jgi:anhydro-N-acetylmuramic acid kinase
VINLGGVGNLTYIGPGDGHGDAATGEGGSDGGRDGAGEDGGAALIAFDTGPGNALIDDLVEARTGARMDAGGAIAARGRVDAATLARLMDHPYFELPAPNSLDRDAFAATPVADLSLEDAAATLVAFTAASLARGFALLPAVPTVAIVTGGGARNPAIVAALSDALPCRVVTGDAIGWSAEFIEAQAFAYLAVRSLSGRPLTYPGTTGVAAPQTGGVVAGRRTRRLPPAHTR